MPKPTEVHRVNRAKYQQILRIRRAVAEGRVPFVTVLHDTTEAELKSHGYRLEDCYHGPRDGESRDVAQKRRWRERYHKSKGRVRDRHESKQTSQLKTEKLSKKILKHIRRNKP